MRFDKIIIRNTTPSETKILLEKNGPLNRKRHFQLESVFEFLYKRINVLKTVKLYELS